MECDKYSRCLVGDGQHAVICALAEWPYLRLAQMAVLEFHEVMGCPIDEEPGLRDCELRVRLIREETEELFDAVAKGDLVEAVDALGDIIYVVLGSAVAWGIDMDAVFGEIHRSNMTKAGPDGPVHDAGGKVVKHPDYSPADVAGVISKMKKRGARK